MGQAWSTKRSKLRFALVATESPFLRPFENRLTCWAPAVFNSVFRQLQGIPKLSPRNIMKNKTLRSSEHFAPELIQWMDRIHFAPPKKPWLKHSLVFTGNHQKPRFLSWCLRGFCNHPVSKRHPFRGTLATEFSGQLGPFEGLLNRGSSGSPPSWFLTSREANPRDTSLIFCPPPPPTF